MGLAHTVGTLLSAPLLALWEARVRAAVDAALDARDPAAPDDLYPLGAQLAWVRDALDALRADVAAHEARAAALRDREPAPRAADLLALRLAGIAAEDAAIVDGADRIVDGVHTLSQRIGALRDGLSAVERQAEEAEARAEAAAGAAASAAARLERAAAPPRVCKVDGCDQPFRARGFCGKHYQLWKRGRLPGFVSPDGTLGFSADGPTWALDAALAGQPARLTDGRVWVAGADVTPG